MFGPNQVGIVAEPPVCIKCSVAGRLPSAWYCIVAGTTGVAGTVGVSALCPEPPAVHSCDG
jgi:hypothetical protein